VRRGQAWAHLARNEPAVSRALTRAIRRRQHATGTNYSAARTAVLEIRAIAEDNDLTYAEAESEYDDPRNQILCRNCGWTMGMICPECAKGCACETTCTGWRHYEEDPDPDLDEERGCPDCGYGANPYDEGEGCPACQPWNWN
jgi:hypothetical protein